jgi:hypothetical protein
MSNKGKGDHAAMDSATIAEAHRKKMPQKAQSKLADACVLFFARQK